MNLSALQIQVQTLAGQYGLSDDLQIRYIDACAELGEVGKELLKASEYGTQAPAASEMLADELGDTLFSLLLLASAAGIDLQAALEGSLRKYRARWEAAGGIGSEGVQP